MSKAADKLVLMTNLFPATTGLPTVIWVGPSYGARHDIRIRRRTSSPVSSVPPICGRSAGGSP
jgi:hypothetical protein